MQEAMPTSMPEKSRWCIALLCVAALAVTASTRLFAQNADASRQGPFERLAIINAMVIPGHGGPAYGPADIIVENNKIQQIIGYNGVTGRPANTSVEADRIIDASGMYVMPGMIDLHAHIRTEPLPLEYIYKMKLAHGVTTMVNGAGRGWEAALEQQRLSNENKITAPRMYPIRDWGPSRSRDPGHMPSADKIAPWHDPSRVSKLIDEVMQDAHVVRIGSLAWNAELFGAVATAVENAGGITTVHLPPSDIAVVNAVTAAELGVTMIEHHYGFGESALGGGKQDFPPDFNYMNEAHRFRQAGQIWHDAPEEALLGETVDRLVASGVALIPDMSAYEVNRDLNRAMGLPWHELYTHSQLIDWYFANPANHASHHWDWTSRDEQRWAEVYQKWGKLVYAFVKRGGHLGYASDDPYLWNTSGIGNVRELQLIHETGLNPLEVIRSATYNSAITLRRPDLGLVQTGYTADLLIVDGNPLDNLRFLYAFGAMDSADGRVVRRGGIRWTIKDGVVFDNKLLMEDVVEIVRKSKEGWTNPVSIQFDPMFAN
ncbi:MAG: amidohydrolase family protein [Congregibacter sp.]